MISFRDSFNVHYLEHIRKHRNICYNSNTKYLVKNVIIPTILIEKTHV